MLYWFKFTNFFCFPIFNKIIISILTLIYIYKQNSNIQNIYIYTSNIMKYNIIILAIVAIIICIHICKNPMDFNPMYENW